MNNKQEIGEIKKALDESKSVFVLIPQNPSLDTTAAALSLFLSLQEAGKNAMIGSPSKMQVELSRLVGIDKVTDKVGNRNLIISFDYKEDSIEKVSYNVEGEKFNLVIQPRAGYPPLNKDSVAFSYEGIDADLIFIIGAQKLENLGQLYEKERQAFTQSTTVNIDRATANSKFGKINLIDSKAASISEIMFTIMKQLSLPMNVDIAGNLLKGIEAQTQNFQAPFTSAQTFEAVAELMRAGAKRSVASPRPVRQWAPGAAASGLGRQPTTFPTIPRPLTGLQPSSPTQFAPPRPQLATPPTLPEEPWQAVPTQMPAAGPAPQTMPAVEPTDQLSRTTPQTPVPTMPQIDQPAGKAQSQRIDTRDIRKPSTQNDQQSKKKTDKPKKDWYEPKIYHGKTKIK